MRWTILLSLALLPAVALAQSAEPKPGAPAKELFGRKAAPAPLAARSIGFYARGCLAGALALPVDGKTWQVMRLSRNRNWGHPSL
ncbi:MAG TPA: penicillin-insensitive murein endopeptidase, partial [Xanthobacteraceae bacterium]|nr:penicillin-insensitive murein endopeptidase [Xanthobacteraceae bacterium]